MSVKKRATTATTSRARREAEEEFIAAAEAPAAESLSVEQRVSKRADGRYFGLISYRGTEEQKALIDFAAKEAGLSKQKLIEEILMPELEKRYGEKFDRV
uniref:ParB n=1 Tax=Corynebacterium glutamicum TaxID=1718 RepID=A0A142EAM6_CORGT|nr:hypothetical protein [Corynebacterium glutamicum]AMQ45214.1 parB [Corynebacterium glutamicum]